MESKKEKVVHITKEMRNSNANGQTAAGQDAEENDAAASPHAAGGAPGQESTETSPAKPRRDMGKAAVFISILAVLLLAVFFYALNRNIAGLASQVESLSALRAQVTEMDGSIGAIQGDISGIHGDIGAMQEKMAILDTVPDMARRTMLRSMLQDLSQRVSFIAEETNTPEQAAKIKAAQVLLDQAQADLAKTE